MKFFKTFNTVFYRLIISYLVLIIVITFLTGMVSFVCFSGNFNKEVERVHLNGLNHLNNVITISVFQKIEKICLDLLDGQSKNSDIQYFISHPIEGNHAKISSVYRILNDVVDTNIDLIDSINIYYPQRNVLISYPSGLKYLSESNRNVYRQQDWFKLISKTSNINCWIGARPVPDNIEVPINFTDSFAYIRSFPLYGTNTSRSCFIIVNVKESAVRNIINELYPDNRGLYIIDNSGRVISNYQKGKLNTKIKDETVLKKLLGSKSRDASFVEKVEGVASVVTFSRMDKTDWRLLNITSVNEFYRRSNVIRQILFFICIFSIIVGIIIANLFASNIYSPLKLLVNNARKLFGETSPASPNKEHEYTLINDIINTLSLKVNNMNRLLILNQPLIKHSLVMDLLNQSIVTKEEFNERLKTILDISFIHDYYAALIVKVDTEAISSLSVENKQFVKFSLISKVEDMTGEDKLFLVAEHTENSFCILVNSREKDDNSIALIAEQLISYVNSTFMVTTSAAIGNWLDDSLQLSVSFKEMGNFDKYIYFMPGTRIFFQRDLERMDNSKAVMSDNLLDEYVKALKSKNMRSVENAISAFIEDIIKGNYSAEYRNQRLSDILYIYTEHIKQFRYKINENTKYDLYESFYRTSGILQFKERLIKLSNSFLTSRAERDNNRNAEIVSTIAAYIENNIGEELSLESIADMVDLSPGYVSKIFKDETGQNYPDYVNMKRLEKAKTLLLCTDLSVASITSRVGYGSSAYFIKKFKEAYGYPPMGYKKYYSYLPSDKT